MRFWQKYSFFEHGFGEQPVLFVLSDNYEELFVEGGSEIDVCLLDNIQKNLDSGNGQFAIDELRFSINELAGKENDLNALSFIKQASDITKNRYCALFMNDAIDLASILFIGKISDKFSRDDIIWSGGQFAVEVYPAGEYKFTAHSFDLSLLEKIKLNSKIDLPDGTKANSIYERIPLSEWQAIFVYRQAYQIRKGILQENYFFSPLGDLGKILQTFLQYTAAAISELIGTNFNFLIQDTILDFQTNPMGYDIIEGDQYDNLQGSINSQWPNISSRLKLKLSAQPGVDYQNGISRIFVSRKMIDPAMGYIEDDKNDFQIANLINGENEYSFRKYDNIADMLAGIAKSLGCFVFIKYGAVNNVIIEFKTREEINELEFTYIKGVSDANLDTSSVISSEAAQYYAGANDLAAEGDDVIKFRTVNKQTKELQQTVKFEQEANSLAKLKENRQIVIERLLLSLSQTLQKIEANIGGGGVMEWLYPLNLTHFADNWNIKKIEQIFDGYKNFWIPSYELLHTAIYVATPTFEASQIQYLGSDAIVYRPAAWVYAKHNGVNLVFDTLSNYINYLIGRDEHYYETEYSLTVPFWNGFSKYADGSDKSWKNIKLGSQVKIKEKLRDYIADEWQEIESDRIYTVVGIEINLQKPETKLKLQNSERFSFSDWDGNIGELPGYVSAPIPETEQDYNSQKIQVFQIADGETILKGDAVQIVSEGIIIKARSFSGYYGKICGISLQAGIGNDIIPVQTTGEVYCEDYQFADVGKMIWCRTNLSELNITEEILSEPNYTEDLMLRLGKTTGEHSFMLDIAEIAYEGGVLPPPM